MSNSIVINRYAKTLFDSSVESDVLDAVYNDMSKLNTVMEKLPELSSFLSNKILASDKKSELLHSIKEMLQPLTFRFIQLLQNKGRLNILSDIPKSFFRLYDKHKNIIKAEVVSAFQLSDSQIENIKAKIKSELNASDIKINCIVDTTLIAGMQIVIGDNVIDANIKQKLSKLKRQLLK